MYAPLDTYGQQPEVVTPLGGGEPGARVWQPPLQPDPFVEVHNFEVKIPVRKVGIKWLPNASDLQNWTMRWDPDFHGVYLGVTTQSILIRAGAEGATRAIAEALVLRKLLRILQLLEEQYGCEFAYPEFRAAKAADFAPDYRPGRTKVGVVGSPLTKGMGFASGELAVVDKTPEPSTIHPRDPNDADRIVEIARNAEAAAQAAPAISQDIRDLTAAQRQFVDLLATTLQRVLAPPAPAAPSPPRDPADPSIG